MSDSPVITVSDVSKHYMLTGSATRSLKATLLDAFRGRRAPHPIVKALDNVSFEVPRGSTLGIIGANGAGKSTLLALLTKTIQPTSGEVHTVGTVSSLLELGAGFHPDLTGRENVFLYGAIMGLSRRQMLKRFDAIVQFADLHEYIDQPVKHYSSGMYVRLGFAVAVEVDPDILLIDEVLAVGDANFQRKCIAKIQAFRAQGKTMLIISHDLPTIQRVSNQILLLDKGRIMGIGQPESMIDRYQAIARERNRKGLEREWGTGEVLITGVDFLNSEGAPTQTFQWGQPLCARVHFDARQAVTDPVFGFAISDEEGRLVYGSNTQIESLPIARIEGPGRLLMKLDRVLMAAGTYLFSFSVHSADHKTNFHRLDNCFSIQVESEKNFEGYCYMPSHWSRES